MIRLCILVAFCFVCGFLDGQVIDFDHAKPLVFTESTDDRPTLSGKVYLDGYYGNYPYTYASYRVDFPDYDLIPLVAFNAGTISHEIEISPDGTKIAHTSIFSDALIKGIVIRNNSGQIIHQFPPIDNRWWLDFYTLLYPWSSDSRYLFFGVKFQGLYRLDSHTWQKTKFLEGDRFGLDYGTVDSPDGTKIAWVFCERERFIHICYANISDFPLSREKIKTAYSYRSIDSYPYVFFIGNDRIIFSETSADEEKGREIFSSLIAYDLDAGKANKLFSSKRKIEKIIVSANKKYLYAEINRRYYIVDLENLQAREIYKTLDKDTWSPDGEYFLTHSHVEKTDTHDVYVYSLKDSKFWKIFNTRVIETMVWTN